MILILILSLRSVYATTINRFAFDIPKLRKRGLALRVARVGNGQFERIAEDRRSFAKATPCFLKLSLALSGSHSNFMFKVYGSSCSMRSGGVSLPR
jgi:hypothetical protein